MRRIKIKQNWLDKIVNFASPTRGVQRLRARATLALVGGYTGASKSRRALSEWVYSAGDADTDILADLPTLRERSRDLTRNNPLACGAINTKVTNVVGSGLSLQSRIDAHYLGLTEEQAREWETAAEREWCLYSESQECDIERTSKFKQLTSIVFRAMLESGDVLANMPMVARTGSPYKTKIQLIEADRLVNEDNQVDTENLSGGIERDENGAPKFYHIMDGHPGDMLTTKQMTWTKVRAFGEKTGRRNILHIYKKTRPGQSRGIPDLAPVIEHIKQLGRYTEAEVMAAVVSGMFTVFIKSEYGAQGSNSTLKPMEPTTETGGKTSDKDFKLANGAILDLMPGEEIDTANPGRPNDSFDPFVLALCRQIGAALELPFEILVKHFTASYSAAQAAMLEAWRYYLTCRNYVSWDFCQPVYEAVITEAVALGRLNAPGFFSGDPLIKKSYFGSEWIGPPRGQIDPVKQNKADELAEHMGWKTGATNAAERGSDWESNHKQLTRENQMRMDAGLKQTKNDTSGNQETGT